MTATPGSSLRAGTADAIVVLGRGIEADGSLPLLARFRVERAVELWRRGVAPRIILSGCASLSEPGPPRVTEAAAMAAYAEHAGVPARALLLEEQSRDTVGNAWFTRMRWCEPNGWQALRIVTSDFHIPRAAWVFAKILGPAYDIAFSAAPSEPSGATMAVRVREESAITAFLEEWLSPLPDGDTAAIAAFIAREHPGYSPSSRRTHQEIQRRVAEFARLHRDGSRVLRGHRARQVRLPRL